MDLFCCAYSRAGTVRLVDGDGSTRYLSLNIELGVILGGDQDSSESSGDKGSADCGLSGYP